PLPALSLPIMRVAAVGDPSRSRAPPTMRRPWPALPTTAGDSVVSIPPPAIVSVPLPSTSSAGPPRPCAVTWPVSVVLAPLTTSWPTAPAPDTVWLPEPNAATSKPPGGAARGPLVVLQSAASLNAPADADVQSNCNDAPLLIVIDVREAPASSAM